MMDVLQKHLSKIRVPCENQSIYKDECMFSYDNPETPTGLYVNLTTFLSFGEEFIKPYFNKTGNGVFLHIRREKTRLPESDAEKIDISAGPERKITRLAIGVEGGADLKSQKYSYKDTYQIVVVPEMTKLPYPNVDLPLIVQQSVEALLVAESAISKLEKQTMTGTWDGEVRQVSKYAHDLKQQDNGKKIPPTGWKCEKCDLTNNLWLNLTDGSILCGRKFFDGSGGNDHAVEYYKQTSFPLAVKLGTITADGKADVFSYPEDDMVIDPNLNEHLSHFGINMTAMQKSEKSMVELELDINQRIGEWSQLTESESELTPLAGPGLTGMRNLGNSCYMNSVMQVIFTIPDFIKRFVDGASKYFDAFPQDPANDFNIQTAKLGTGLWSGKYSSIAENTLDTESTGISPAMFKNIIGKNHPDFSTKQQQDACEFFLYFLNLLERNSRGGGPGQANPSDALLFCLEDRFECGESKKVKYTKREEFCLPLIIPLSAATNQDEVQEYQEKLASSGKPNTGENVVRPKISLQACLDNYFQTEIIEQFFSSAINGMTTAKKTTRLASMPDYMMLHLKKFTLREDWVPIKLDVSVDMPAELDLSVMRSSGLQPNEETLPNDVEKVPEVKFDQAVMSELLVMGFPEEACKRAIFNTKNAGLDVATQWIMEHICDADFAAPFTVPGINKTKAFQPNEESLAMLMSMGFNEKQATAALKATDNNIERATDWIFSHADSLDSLPSGMEEDDASADAAAPASKTYRDGDGKYSLVAFISHMGTSSQVGHYVCHIKKDNQWVIFNDSKVAVSQNPPKDLGYLYLYKRQN
ncbi:ubiquitin carboxyl-terminal hydrolase 5 [Eupeodes corollae]|uniref:ubiquitin carboxyl-terminal hydrolase 5 n=1 Tax=Eupeodes corollae TaxID=290404 RepID=UPI00249355FA|nr:ubiquitin carboxyl-terminal hydrolase 5 [Eupeodes corollae]